MTSTVVNEDLMLKLLSVEATGPNARELLTGACMVLLDAYDRRLPRDKAEIYITNTMNAFDLMGRLQAFSNTLAHFTETGTVTRADLLTAVQGCEELVKRQMAEIIKLAKLLPECPNDEDTVQ